MTHENNSQQGAKWDDDENLSQSELLRRYNNQKLWIQTWASFLDGLGLPGLDGKRMPDSTRRIVMDLIERAEKAEAEVAKYTAKTNPPSAKYHFTINRDIDGYAATIWEGDRFWLYFQRALKEDAEQRAQQIIDALHALEWLKAHGQYILDRAGFLNDKTEADLRALLTRQPK